MKIITAEKNKVDYNDFIKRSAKESDFSQLISESCILKDREGKTIVLYQELGNELDTRPAVKALKKIKYHKGKRSRGLVSNSRIFGYRPRMTIRADYCSSTSLAKDFPEEHNKVCDLGIKLSELYFKKIPETWEKHREVIEDKVKKEWIIPDSIFTSGIINKNNPLKYHFDTGNFNDVFSVMIVFKSGIEGGYLSLPEYGLGFELKHNSVFMFDGQSILHGVTPIIKESPLSFRYSIVYYSLKQMWKCLEVDGELARIRNKKTEREKIRHNMPEEHRQSLEKRWGKQ